MNPVEKIIREYVEGVVHLSLATVRDGKPWVCEVHYAYDEALHFYFISLPSRRHSIDLAHDIHVAGNIVRQHAAGEKVRAVYFEGTCVQLENVQETDLAYTAYRDRFGIGLELLQEQREQDGHKFYQITVEKFAVFDELELDPAGKHELEWSN